MSMTTKVNAIYTAIQERDLQTLRELSRTDEGLLYDRLRRAAWYVLIFIYFKKNQSRSLSDKSMQPLTRQRAIILKATFTTH